MKRLILLIASIGLLALIISLCIFLNTPMRFTLSATSPIGSVNVRGLPFEGSSPHALDGTLRLFIGDSSKHGRWNTKIQTKIEFGRDLEIRWLEDESNETFAIYKDGTKHMTFQISQDEVSCIDGVELVATDPYIQKQAEQVVAPDR